MMVLAAFLFAILLLIAGYWLRVWIVNRAAPVDPAPASEWTGEVISFPNAYNVRVVSEDE